jgi:hypothetical protein
MNSELTDLTAEAKAALADVAKDGLLAETRAAARVLLLLIALGERVAPLVEGLLRPAQTDTSVFQAPEPPKEA